MKQGFLRLSRNVFDHWLWEESRVYSKAEAWLDLLQMAAFTQTKRIVREHLIHLEIGELIASTRYLGQRWSWGKDRVATFLQLLESDEMIQRDTRQGESVVTICKYETYNAAYADAPDSPPTPARHSADSPATEVRRPADTEQTTPRQVADTPPTKYKKEKNSEEIKEGQDRKKPKAQSSPDDLSWNTTDGWTGISEEDRGKWAELFPACDINRQLGLANEWLLANPAKAHKTLWRRFIVNWLSRTQERGGDLPSNPIPSEDAVLPAGSLTSAVTAAISPTSSGEAIIGATPREPWKIESDIKRIQSQITEIRNDERRHEFVTEDGVSRKVMKPFAREELRRLKAKIQKLKDELMAAA